MLDCLDIVKDKHDGTLAYRKSCRMMICGSCGMRMDGGAVLACKTRMYDIAQSGHVPVISAMGTCRSSRTSSSTWTVLAQDAFGGAVAEPGYDQRPSASTWCRRSR
jgi:succinate dehydrogenase/fumarate reductase-like Fe-S protein